MSPLLKFAHEHERFIAWFYTAFVVAAVVAMVVLYHNVTEQTKRGRTAAAALCAFREDLDQRIAGTQKFLSTHPDGFAGLHRSLLVNNLRNQKRTRETLNVLPCPG